MSLTHKKIGAPWMKGKKLEYVSNSNSTRRREKHPMWKGNDATYTSKHIWISNNYGKPLECELCGNNKLKPRSYHWANISGEYKRKIEDWIRLCVSCHKKYDNLRRNK